MRIGWKAIVGTLGFALLMALAVQGQVKKADEASTPLKVAPSILDRIKFLNLEANSRFRYVDKNAGNVTDRDLQYKIMTRMQIDLVGEGKTYLQVRGESGRSNTSSWDYTGAGLNKRYWSFNMKSLFVGQKIGSHFEAQAGGIEYDPGAGTETTYADNDAWLVGYRLRYTAAKKWWPNKISATVGYVGDFKQPNVFARLRRMGDENYIQILASKKFGKNRELSAEFDSIQATRFTREAFRWQKMPLIVVDDLTLEAITRATDNPTFGWASTLGKSLDKKGRLRLGVFYSDLPLGIFKNGETVIFQNGDTYALGKRVGPTARISPIKNFEISVLGTSRLDSASTPRYRGQVACRYQFADLLNQVLH